MSDRERRKLFNTLCKTCSRNRVIPKSMHIPDCSKGSVGVEWGGYANVSQSTCEGRQVAVKVVRVYVTSDLNAILSVSPLSTHTVALVWTNVLQRFCREGVAWKHLRHQNILPLLKVTVSENGFAMVSEWMENGDINKFVKRHPYLNPTELVRRRSTPQGPH